MRIQLAYLPAGKCVDLVDGKSQSISGVLYRSLEMLGHVEASIVVTYDVEFALALCQWACLVDKQLLLTQHWTAILETLYTTLGGTQCSIRLLHRKGCVEACHE